MLFILFGTLDPGFAFQHMEEKISVILPFAFSNGRGKELFYDSPLRLKSGIFYQTQFHLDP
jgi:hypothetical protein